MLHGEAVDGILLKYNYLPPPIPTFFYELVF